MRVLITCVALLFGINAAAQVEIRVNVPAIRFEAPPPLVEVEPGVQVVPDREDEVFFVNGFYWTRREGRWFRSRDHRGGWVVVEGGGIPVVLTRIPSGRYRRWHGEERRERHEEIKAERREDKREWREHKREEHERREGDEHERGRKHGHDHEG